MIDKSNRYTSDESEKKWLKYWKEKKTYKFNPKTEKEIFSIDFPPPTVSGRMHVGHSFSYAQEDFIARYKRMKGYEVFLPFGTDDNGLATERLIEKTKKVRSKNMPRDEFVKLCLDTLKEIRPDFTTDWIRLGISCDYDITYSTIDDHSRKISQQSFIDLYNKGLEYRKFAPIIFCPQCQTAIAQVELEDKQDSSTLNYIKAKLEDGRYLIYATTRPELIYGCVGMSISQEGKYVTVSTEEEEWIISKEAIEKVEKWANLETKNEFKGKELVGLKVTIPLSEIQVEISHDEVTETKYGTGIVYYCTYGGMDCIEWLTRHPGVEPINVMGTNGRYKDMCGPIAGKKSTEARKIILEKLEKNGDLIKKEAISHAVNVHERCGTSIEYVATEQWFIKILDQQDKWLKVGNELKWKPEFMKTRYDNWVNGLKWDWCISRQRHFGVPIPIWYCNKCKEVNLPESEQLPVDPLKDKPNKPCKCGSEDFTPEKDVLDTWATSSLTPIIAAGLVPEIKDKLYPMSFRQNSHDILTFWLFNTVIKSQLENNVNPWKDVAITGWVLDKHGKKMSKSKGNIIDPREVWEKFSVDAGRFAAGRTKLGADYSFQEKDVMTGQKTVTKLDNASKFVFMHLENFDPNTKQTLQGFDRWMLSKLNNLTKMATESMNEYSYSKTLKGVENLFWLQFCDVYLEAIKDRLYNPETRGEENTAGAKSTLQKGMLNILKLFAPFMPYITEDVYQRYYSKLEVKQSIHVSSWPVANEALIDENTERVGDQLVEVISAVRKAKSEKGVSLKEPVKELVLHLKKEDVAPFIEDLKAVTKAEKIRFGKEMSVSL
jgi:valyl-tRNA synthetase